MMPVVTNESSYLDRDLQEARGLEDDFHFDRIDVSNISESSCLGIQSTLLRVSTSGGRKYRPKINPTIDLAHKSTRSSSCVYKILPEIFRFIILMC
jgi:hypothetical protein